MPIFGYLELRETRFFIHRSHSLHTCIHIKPELFFLFLSFSRLKILWLFVFYTKFEHVDSSDNINELAKISSARDSFTIIAINYNKNEIYTYI